jgi:hypothetical protein
VVVIGQKTNLMGLWKSVELPFRKRRGRFGGMTMSAVDRRVNLREITGFAGGRNYSPLPQRPNLSLGELFYNSVVLKWFRKGEIWRALALQCPLSFAR